MGYKLKWLVITSFLFSLCTKAEVRFVSDNGFIVHNEIVTDAAPETVWQALVQDVDNWWPKDHSWWGADGTFSIQAYAGGCFCEKAGARSAEHMHISFVDPNKLLRMTGGLGPLQGMGMHGALDWKFSQANGKTKVELIYAVSGINPDGFQQLAPIVASVQQVQLNGLKRFVDNLESN